MTKHKTQLTRNKGREILEIYNLIGLLWLSINVFLFFKEEVQTGGLNQRFFNIFANCAARFQ